MASIHTPVELEIAEKNLALYKNLYSAMGPNFKYDRFLGWENQYLRPSREFHGLNHMLAMSEMNPTLSRRSNEHNAGFYSMVSGFFHDEDYPSIDEPVTHMSREYIDRYIEERDGKQYIKPLAANDPIGKILLGTFGFQEGQMLSPFPFGDNPGGMNEFFCAVAAACELHTLGKDLHFILGVTAGIEATIPFRTLERMDQLRSRIAHVGSLLNLNLTQLDTDEMMVGAVHTANKDVTSFLGGMDPNDPDAHVNTETVLYSILGGDLLSPEEVPALRVNKSHIDTIPGNYSPRDFLSARIKRAGLYHLVLPGDDGEQTIKNLFYKTTLSGGDTYPHNGWTTNANKLAYENSLPVRTAEYARLISAGIVNALVEQAAKDPDNVKIKDLLDKLPNIMKPCSLPDDASKVRKLAFACVSGREPSSGYDIARSPIAEFILSKLDERQVEALGKAARDLLLPGDFTEQQIASLNKTHPGLYEAGDSKEQAFLKLTSQYLGTSLETIRDNIVRSAQGCNAWTVGAEIKQLSLPKVNSIP